MHTLQFSDLRRLLMMLLVCFLLPPIFAQTLTVTGRVIDDLGEPVIGANIVMKSDPSKGTVTDFDGNYSIVAQANDVIIYKFIGYKTQEIPVQNRTVIDVKLITESELLDNVVVVGYGTMRKVEVTGSVSRVDAEAIAKVNTSDVGTALQGQVAGVNVQMSSGQPGDVANVQIRGISSITGSNQPLYVVDGIPLDGDPGLSTNEIESIDVLKDAASAAIYGTRGSGGVILITTKKGREGKFNVAVDANYGIQQITSKLYLTDAAQEYAQTVMDTYMDIQQASNNIWTVAKTNQTKYADNSNMASLIEQNRQPVSNINLTLSGGAKGATYSIVGNYFQQEGVIINSGFDRFNIRANTDFKRGRWSFGANLATKLSEKRAPASNLYRQVYNYDPTSPTFNPDLEEGTTPGDQLSEKQTMGTILALFKEQNNTDTKSFDGNFSIGVDLIKDLKFMTRLGTSYGIAQYERFKPLFKIYDEFGALVPNPNTRSSVTRRTTENNSLVWESILSYGLKVKKHDLKLTGVFGMEEYNRDGYEITRFDLITNDLSNFESMTGETIAKTGTTLRQTTLIGMLLRAQYNYNDRYLLSASVRRDASSRFGYDNRWGTFPSVSAGWSISEEKFFEPLKDKINMFKLRASYGTTGNQNFADYIYSAAITTGLDYAFGNNDGSTAIDYGAVQTQFANMDIKWETTEQINAGIDLSLLDSRLSITADVYQTTKKDMLLPLSVAPSAGSGTNGSVTVNVGDMENKGAELAIGWRDQVNDFAYNANVTVSRNANKVLKMSGDNKMMGIGMLNPGASNDYVTYLVEGEEAGAFMLYQTDGVINTEEKLKAYSKLSPAAVMGDLMYVDLDGDGSITENDRRYYGSGAPEMEFGLNLGFNWKGFDVSTIWYASVGNEVINGSKCSAYQQHRHLDVLYAWTPWNVYSPIPTLAGAGHSNYKPSTDYWVEDGSYLRLNNLVVGYQFPERWLTKAGITKLRLYFSADNILTMTRYKGYNPGVGNNGLSQRGIDNGTYPISAQFRGGLQLSF